MDIISIIFLLKVLMPDLMNLLIKFNIAQVFPQKPLKFLEDTINEIIKRRKANLDVREDFIQYMIEHEDKGSGEEAKNETQPRGDDSVKSWQLKKTLTNREILSQAVLFLIAGYDTTATCLEFISYHLATHKAIQDRLIEEVDKVLENHVKFTFSH